MNRKEFLKGLGFSGAAIFATYCMGGLTACSSSTSSPTPSNPTNPGTTTKVDFTLDLTQNANAALNVNGGFVINTANQVVVARTTSGSFAAVTIVCSHEGNPNVSYNSSANNFRCSVHGATFDLQGRGTNANGSRGIKAYQTTLTGNLLRVFEA
jgi:cytochrome b6-f complex iron-sulfur subunit